jgi:lysozyme
MAEKDIVTWLKEQGAKMKTYIRENEGSNIVDGRHMPYKCTAGKLTCGYGRNIEDKGISEYEATIMLDSDIADSLTDLRKIFTYDEFDTLSFNRKMALTDMVFNLGMTKFLGFKKMIQAIKDKDFDEAAIELMDSSYARQVKIRAIKNRDLIRGG